MKPLPGHFINGEWKQGSGESLNSINPATGEIIFETYAANTSDIADSVKSAKDAFPSWKKLPLEKRIGYLNDFSQILDAQQTPLAQAISLETGKPFWESHQEVKSMISKISISIEAYTQRCSQKESLLPIGKSVTRHKPHGVVAVLGPFNFPGHLPNGHIIPALLAGNTVIFKPSESTPLVGSLLAQCWKIAQLPPGVFNLIQGKKETGQLLTSSPEINGIFFTGSWSTGKILLEQFNAKPDLILALEMGGNNPLVVSQISNIDAAAYITIQSAFLTSGQRCTCARRLILIDNPNSEEFLNRLIKMIGTLRIGPFTDIPEPFMGPVISHTAAQNIIKKQEQLHQLGGKFLLKSEVIKEGLGFISPGLIDVTEIKELPDEEIFGPFLQVIRVKDFQSAIHLANKTQYGLSAGLLSSDSKEYDEFYQYIQAGVINWNTSLTGASSSAPFGGIKKSGNYRPSAFYAADYCSRPVASIEATDLKMPLEPPIGIDFT